MNDTRWDVTVVGGGLGGLATAALLARQGLEVCLLERATQLGGRAITHQRGGYSFNEGAHALYRGGAAMRVLERLGVTPRGRKPPVNGVMVKNGRRHVMPATVGSLLTTGLVGASAKLQGAKIFARLGSFDCDALADVAWSTWVEKQVSDVDMRAALEAFVRVSTYANAPTQVSAGATIAQLTLAQKPGVLYLDGGWQALADGLANAARGADVHLVTGARVTRAELDAYGWRTTRDGDSPILSRALVLATGPLAARSVVASPLLETWAARTLTARAACLDVALTELPDARTLFALGVDQPTYLSVHSSTARLAPEGAALVSTMKYLPVGEPTDPGRDQAELEALIDLLQPGWRDVLVERRFLPHMIATNAIVTAEAGGFAGRPGPRVLDAPGAFVVGDWVGGEGMLLDASLASAERAAVEITRELGVAEVA